MNTSFKLRFYPTRTQAEMLPKLFGHARWAYNFALELRTKAYRRRGERVTSVDAGKLVTRLKKTSRYAWLGDVPTSCLQQAMRDLDRGFVNFFEGRAKHPRFRKRSARASCRVTLDWRHAGRCAAWDEGRLALPGLGQVKLRGRAMPCQRPKMATVSRDAMGRCFVAFSVEVEQEEFQEAKYSSVGIDVNVSEEAYVVTSRGERYGNVKAFARWADALKRQQQRLARQVKGSGRWHRTRGRVARACAKNADCRREHLHRISDALTRQNQIVIGETLNAKGMAASAKGTWDAPGKNVAQKRGLSRSIMDAAFGELSRQVDYKCERRGRTRVKVDRWFPSSKLCSACGLKNEALALNDRSWTCRGCGTTHDRDWNAAKNIEAEGLRTLGEHAPGAQGKGKKERPKHPEVTGKDRCASDGAGVVRAPGGGSDGGRVPRPPGLPPCQRVSGRERERCLEQREAGPRGNAEMGQRTLHQGTAAREHQRWRGRRARHLWRGER